MKTQKIKTAWNLRLLYKNENDPQLERDVVELEKIHTDFEKRFKNSDFTSTPEKLAAALATQDVVVEKMSAARPLHYLHLARDIDATNPTLTALINKYTDRLTKAANKTLFFNLAISKIPAKQHKELLNHSKLAHYKYALEILFKEGVHRLTEPEEKILSLKQAPSAQLWVAGVEKQIAKQTLRWKGKMIPLPEAQNLIAEAATADRRKLHAGVTEAFKAVADFSESEMNAIYLNKKINDELRNYRTPEEATILAYENEPKVVERLVQEVTAAFPISHRFYKVKAKILKVKRFQYEDRAAIAGKIKQSFAFEDALTLTRSVFESINPYYSETLNSYLRNGQIDIYPRAGKHGGAYCSGAVGKIPTFVLLNHTASLRSTETLAHEMGHAFHTELSKHQPIRYQGYTTSVAEVASTFFEQFVSEAILKKLSEKEKIIALHDRIQGDIQTIFRQIACFNFEKDLHLLIRSKGAVTKEETAALLNKHMKAYLGPLFDMRPDDGYAFVGWPHIRRFFYVYSYAYGQLISKALYARYKANPSYLEKIEQFLKAGCSKSPEQIFTEIGIDVVSPDFWKQGLAQIEADIAQLEKLTHGII